MKDFSNLVSDCVTLITGHSSGLASHLKKINPHLISLCCFCHKLAWKYNRHFHQKSAMGELCWMTSFVARGVIRGSILAASVQDNYFLPLGFSVTASTFQFSEVIIRKVTVINKIIRNNHWK